MVRVGSTLQSFSVLLDLNVCVCVYVCIRTSTNSNHSVALLSTTPLLYLSPRILPTYRTDSTKNKHRSVPTASGQITSYRKLVGLVLFIFNSATMQGHGEL